MINIYILLYSKNNFSTLVSIMDLKLLNLVLDFTWSGFFPGISTRRQCWSRFFSLLSPYVMSKIQKLSFMDWKSGALCRWGVSQLPAYLAWQGPVYILFCFTSYRFRKAFRLSNNSRVMLEITAMNYVRHVRLLPRGQFILEQITGLFPVVSCVLYM